MKDLSTSAMNVVCTQLKMMSSVLARRCALHTHTQQPQQHVVHCLPLLLMPRRPFLFNRLMQQL